MAALRGKGVGAATFVVLAVLFVGLTVVFNHAFRGARLDLTENRLYTLAPGTARLVGSLKEPVNLYFYFSQQASVAVPPLRAYAERVRELLAEIAARSGGKIRLHVVDPQPYSDDEDRATELGLKAVPIGAGDETIWFGLAGSNSTDGHAVIEFFQPDKEEFLEYDVARLIHELGAPARKVVGLVSTLPLGGGFDPESGGMRPPWVIGAQLRELFDVKTVAPDATALPAGLDALFIVQPKGLSPALSYAIDQYLVGGGRALLCVDPDSQLESAAGPAAAFAGADKSSTFEPMLTAWGVGYNPREAVGDLEHALLVGNPGGGQPVRHLGFAGLGEGSLAKGDVITTSLGTINFATPGYLEPRKVDGVSFEPLVTTGTESAPIPVERLRARGDAGQPAAGLQADRQALRHRRAGLGPAAERLPGGPAGRRHRRAAAPRARHPDGEPGRRRRHRLPRRHALGADRQPLRPALRRAVGQQRRLRPQRARQPDRQRRPDRHPRAANVLAAVHARRPAAGAGRRAAARQGGGTRAAARRHRAQARRAAEPSRGPPVARALARAAARARAFSAGEAAGSARSCAPCATGSTSRSSASARTLKLLNVVAMPLLLSIAALAVTVLARRRRRARHGTAA